MNKMLAAFCRARGIPLGLRRRAGQLFVPHSSSAFMVEIEGREYRGHLDNYIEWIVYITGQYFEYTYLNLIRSFNLGGCAIDVGANVGNHATAFADMFDEVVAVEPYLPVYSRLKEKARGLANLRIHQIAFGAEEAEMGFAAPTGANFGAGHLDEGGGLKVNVVTGDDFLAGKHAADIRFIKIDVEGHEAAVLQGLRKTLERDRPVVFYEAPKAFSGDAGNGESLADSFGLFPEGYRFWGLPGQSTFPVQRGVARPVPLTGGNLRRRFSYVLAAPEERGLPLPAHA